VFHPSVQGNTNDPHGNKDVYQLLNLNKLDVIRYGVEGVCIFAHLGQGPP
jgi:hypothetical protein